MKSFPAGWVHLKDSIRCDPNPKYSHAVSPNSKLSLESHMKKAISMKCNA
jgi:hypothetical protein